MFLIKKFSVIYSVVFFRFFCLILVAFFTLSSFNFIAFAAGNNEYTYLEPIDPNNKTITISEGGLSTYLNSILTWVLVLVSVVAIFYLIYGGILYVTTDIINKKLEGKETVTRVVTGIVFIFSVWVLLNSINPNLLKNNLGFAGGAVGATTGTTPGSGTVKPVDPTPVSGEVKNLAQQLLDLKNQNKIKITDYSSNMASDRKDRSLASLQLEDLAAGKQANLSSRCITGSTNADPKLLSFLVDLAAYNTYTISSLFGQCHSDGSAHYSGKAVDFGCPFNVSQGDAVANKYGVRRYAAESCGGKGNHYHYSN